MRRAVLTGMLWVAAALVCGCARPADLEGIASNPDRGECFAPPPAPGAPEYPGNRHPDLTPPPLKWAIARADNDAEMEKPYMGEGDRLVPLPEAVRRKICEVTLAHFNDTLFEGPTKCADLFGPVFRIRTPFGDGQDIYVYKMRGIMMSYYGVVLVYDARSNRVSPKAGYLPCRWLERRGHEWLMDRPLVRFDDLNMDGRPDVVLETRFHNGTEWNGVWYEYHHVADDLSLVPVFIFEARRDPGSDMRVCGLNGCVVRTIEKVAPNRIIVRSKLAEKPFQPGDREIGYVVLESPDAASPFRVKETVAHMDRWRTYLLNVLNQDPLLPSDGNAWTIAP